ncbi:hypothetical protein [Streptomyces sp. NPDC001450]
MLTVEADAARVEARLSAGKVECPDCGGVLAPWSGRGASRGYPRAVNNLALQALVAAFATGKNLVDEAAARASVSEVVGD